MSRSRNRACAIVTGVTLVGALAMSGAGARSRPLSIYVDLPFQWFARRTPADFIVSIDDEPVDVMTFATGPQPLNAITLLDLSDSMPSGPDGKDSIDVMKVARRIAGVARKTDLLRIATFGQRILIGRSLLLDPASAESAARAVTQRGGPSPLWDAIDHAVTALAGLPGLPALIVFTDAQASANDLGFADAMARIVGSGVLVSAVGISDEAMSQSSVQIIGRNANLQRLVDASGGTYVELRTRKDLPIEFLAGLVANVRSRTRLEIEAPARDGRVHRLSVRVGRAPVRAPSQITGR